MIDAASAPEPTAASDGVPKRDGFNPHIHGARGLFALAVFFHHIANSGLPTFRAFEVPVIHAAFLSLQYGVELFFGISGIVILGAVARSPGFAAFAWDRATRILPVLWATLFVITALALATGDALPPLGLWLANFLPPPPMFLIPQINPAAWSLGYELTFYLLVAIAWQWRTRRAILVLIVVAGIALTIILPRALLMLPGILIALYATRDNLWGRIGRWPCASLIAFLICWTATSIIQFGNLKVLLVFGPPYISDYVWLASLGPMILSGFFGTATLAGIYLGQGVISRLLLTAPMLWLGTISYSFYLWHPIGVAIAKQGLIRTDLMTFLGPWSQLALFVAALPPCLIIAAVSQRLLEGRLTRWLRRQGPHKRAGPVDHFLAASGRSGTP